MRIASFQSVETFFNRGGVSFINTLFPQYGHLIDWIESSSDLSCFPHFQQVYMLIETNQKLFSCN